MQSKPSPTSVSDVVVAASPELALSSKNSIWVSMVDRMKRGDATAVGELVRILGEGDSAQEALVETYARAWNRLHTFDSVRSALLPWLILPARGVAFERPERPVSPPPGLREASQTDDHYAVARAFFDGVREGDLRGALMRLREKKGEDAR